MRGKTIHHGSPSLEAICVLCVPVVMLLTGCRQDMHDQPKYKPLAESGFFADGRSERPPVEDTVARGQLHEDELLYFGRVDKAPAKVFPFPVTREVLERGKERFDIFCSPCHSRVGDGRGMVTQRGLRGPPSFHIARLREAPPGHFFDVVTNGFGAMSSYASRIPVTDRWAIIAYIRALQLSQRATVADVPPGQRQQLTGGAQ